MLLQTKDVMSVIKPNKIAKAAVEAGAEELGVGILLYSKLRNGEH